MGKKFNVIVHYEGAMNYEVDAMTEDEAKAKAEELFSGENGDTILGNVALTEICDCNEVSAEESVPQVDEPEHEPINHRMSLYERRRSEVYATGNRWAIENFEATHN